MIPGRAPRGWAEQVYRVRTLQVREYPGFRVPRATLEN